MPDRDVRTIRDLIYYQYAKIIARRAFAAPDGKQAKQQHYGFIKKTFRELQSGAKSWSEITREDWQLVEADKRCGYCSVNDGLHREHIVPKSLQLTPKCSTCPVIQGIHNQIWGCGTCNSAKSSKGLYQFYHSRYPAEQKFYDFIPPLIEKKYLKTIYNCHECAQTLNRGDLDGDGRLSVLDIDAILSWKL